MCYDVVYTYRFHRSALSLQGGGGTCVHCVHTVNHFVFCVCVESWARMEKHCGHGWMTPFTYARFSCLFFFFFRELQQGQTFEVDIDVTTILGLQAVLGGNIMT